MTYPPGSQEAADRATNDELEEADAAAADAELDELNEVNEMPAEIDDELAAAGWIDEEARRAPDRQDRWLRNLLRERLAVEEAYGPRPDLLAPAAFMAARTRARSAVMRIRGLS
jgi:hypothetical protein